MDQKQLKEAIGRPQMLRLKMTGAGLKVGKVLGSRVLVKTVMPQTELDRVERAGTLYIPKSVKDDNTPLPTTGIVIQVGPEVPKFWDIESDPDGKLEDIIQPGDMVLFPKFSGTDMTIENEDLRILEAKEILCTLVDTEEVLREEAI